MRLRRCCDDQPSDRGRANVHGAVTFRRLIRRRGSQDLQALRLEHQAPRAPSPDGVADRIRHRFHRRSTIGCRSFTDAELVDLRKLPRTGRRGPGRRSKVCGTSSSRSPRDQPRHSAIASPNDLALRQGALSAGAFVPEPTGRRPGPQRPRRPDDGLVRPFAGDARPLRGSGRRARVLHDPGGPTRAHRSNASISHVPIILMVGRT